MAKILVVDDDPGVLFMLGEVFRDAGHEVVTTLDPEETLSLLPGVDAALIDLHMPGIDGVHLVARIRDRDAGLPVILLTGGSPSAARAQARQSGAFDVMIKPVHIDELAQLVDRALEASRQRRARAGER